MREPASHRRARPRGFLADERDVATVLGLLALELSEEGLHAVPLGGEQPHEDLLAERWRPARPSREPGAERAFPTRGQPEDPPQACSALVVAAGDETAALELVEELVDLADVRMPERPDSFVEALQQLVAVRLPLAEERQQRVAQVHVSTPGARQRGACHREVRVRTASPEGGCAAAITSHALVAVGARARPL